MAAKKKSGLPQPVAVIDIGSSAVRMVIAEILADGTVRPLENVQKPVALGKDVFVSHRISRTGQLQTLQVLEGFRDLMRQYDVKNYRAVGTSALREAADSEMFLDRIYMRTGIDVEVIEGIEENRLTFAAVHDVMGDRLGAREDALMIEVGAGNTEITVQRQGKVVMSHTLRAGSLRLLQERGDARTDRRASIRSLRTRVANTADLLTREFEIGQIDNFVAMGADARFVAKQIGDQSRNGYAVIDVQRFQDFVGKLSLLGEDEIIDTYHVSYADAETLVPALIVYSHFIELTSPQRILVPMVSLRDGLLLEFAQMLSGKKHSDFSRQIVANAEALGVKYHYDEVHAHHVTKVALQLYDFLQDEHGLGSRERLLLEVAGILHDIGSFVATTGHHKHGQYLVENSEIFGLRKNDLAIVGNVIRYHRRALPGEQHAPYMSLSRVERTIVCKQSAILRVADALDRSHRQIARRVTFEREGDELIVMIGGHGDISLERTVMPEKADLFESVFGMNVSVRQAIGRAVNGS